MHYISGFTIQVRSKGSNLLSIRINFRLFQNNNVIYKYCWDSRENVYLQDGEIRRSLLMCSFMNINRTYLKQISKLCCNVQLLIIWLINPQEVLTKD